MKNFSLINESVLLVWISLFFSSEISYSSPSVTVKNNKIISADRDICGPDLTHWFVKEIKIFDKIAAQEIRKLSPKNNVKVKGDNDYTRKLLNSFANESMAMLVLMYLAPYMQYKMYNFNPNGKSTDCKASVTLCGICIRKNQLGNIMFGMFAKVADLEDEALAYGRKSFAIGPNDEWAKNPWKETAFQIGIGLVDESDSGLIENEKNFCQSFIRLIHFNVEQLHRESPLKYCELCQPQKTIWNGPHTDFSKPPLTDPYGNAPKK